MKTRLEILNQIYDDQQGQIIAAEVNIRLYTQDQILIKDAKLSGQVELKLRQLKGGKERAERSLKIIAEMIQEEESRLKKTN